MASPSSVEMRLTDETLRLMSALQARFGPGRLARALFDFFASEVDRTRAIVRSLAVPPRLEVRSGALRERIDVVVGVRQGGLPTLKVGVFRGTDKARAVLAQEFGTTGRGGQLPTIRPRGRAFPVPQARALDSRGVDRFGGPQRYPGRLDFVPFKNPRNPNVIGALFDHADRRAFPIGELVRRRMAVYLLLRKVDLRPRSFMRDGLTLLVNGGLPRRLAEFLRRLMTGKTP